MRKTAVVERVFRADVKKVFQVYWEIEIWPRILRSIRDAHTEYDDGTHQYFTMVAMNGGALETVRGVRIATPYQKLEMCQFAPPPGFTLMRGEWRFSASSESCGIGTLVSAEREFATTDPDQEPAVSLRLEALLARNLADFDSYLSYETT